MSNTAINGDLSRRVTVDTEKMDWAPSPSGTVWRKRLHLVGPAESGQVTSVVRYDPSSSFPVHEHPDGEEILVLAGVFSDDQGDWPAGTYLLNPEGFRHAPYSADGCVLFVKLRQYPGRDRAQVAVSTEDMAWQPTSEPGVELKPLYSQPGFTDTVRLERWAPGVRRKEIEFDGGVEIFVLDGEVENDDGQYGSRSWIRLPPGTSVTLATGGGCTLYVKEGGFTYLKSG